MILTILGTVIANFYIDNLFQETKRTFLFSLNRSKTE